MACAPSEDSDQPLLSTWRKLGSLAIKWVHGEDSDQTVRMPRLIWVFAGRTATLLVLSRGGSFMIYLTIFTGFGEKCGPRNDITAVFTQYVYPFPLERYGSIRMTNFKSLYACRKYLKMHCQMFFFLSFYCCKLLQFVFLFSSPVRKYIHVTGSPRRRH